MKRAPDRSCKLTPKFSGPFWLPNFTAININFWTPVLTFQRFFMSVASRMSALPSPCCCAFSPISYWSSFSSWRSPLSRLQVAVGWASLTSFILFLFSLARSGAKLASCCIFSFLCVCFFLLLPPLGTYPFLGAYDFISCNERISFCAFLHLWCTFLFIYFFFYFSPLRVM